MGFVDGHAGLGHLGVAAAGGQDVCDEFLKQQEAAFLYLTYDCLGNRLVIQCAFDVVIENCRIGPITDFKIQYDVLFLCSFLRIEADKGPQAQVSDVDGGLGRTICPVRPSSASVTWLTLQNMYKFK